jgi:DNA-binding beta-propeller fold protein YncE
MALATQTQTAPRYQFDPDWPKLPLPNKWWMMGVTGLAVDKDDNIWVLTRPNDIDETQNYAELNPPTAECCVRPPAIIEFDQQGNVVNSFNPPQGHGMVVDRKGFVWIGSDTVRKYEGKTGKLVGTIERIPERQPGGGGGDDAAPAAAPAGRGGGAGAAGAARGGGGRGGNAAALAEFRAKYPPSTPMIVGGIEEVRTDDAANEIYVLDNYLNGRILVFDMDTLAFKRGWGAYGKPLSEISTTPVTTYDPKAPPAKDFINHVTIQISRDGLVYAADRRACRIQVYTKQGKFIKEFFVATETLNRGSAGGIAFSADPQQRYMFISDISNNTIWILNREDGKLLGRIGSAGDNGGQFHGLHMIATDSRGNIYTGEVQAGERVQRFVPQR